MCDHAGVCVFVCLRTRAKSWGDVDLPAHKFYTIVSNRVLKCVAVLCIVAVCSSVLQCVAVCCGVLQCAKS